MSLLREYVKCHTLYHFRGYGSEPEHIKTHCNCFADRNRIRTPCYVDLSKFSSFQIDINGLFLVTLNGPEKFVIACESLEEAQQELAAIMQIVRTNRGIQIAPDDGAIGPSVPPTPRIAARQS